MAGVVSLTEALERADNFGLDLIEISPNAKPPVCKISDFGKFRYEEQKRLSEARKKQKTVTTKEVKIRPNIEQHDLDVKIRRAKKFIEDGNKVRFSMQFRGREHEHKDIGMKVMVGVRDIIEEIGKIEKEPRLEGGQILMITTPKG